MFARSVSRILRSNIRRINQCSVRHHNFDGETYTKTNITLLTKEEDDPHTYIEAYSALGFSLTSGLRILGPCVLFPKSVLSWAVSSSEDITPESLSLFSILEPKPDVLIIGVGDRGAKYDKNLITFLRKRRINVEILPTEQACATFNFLNSERRVVAAALIPPTDVESMDPNEFEIFHSNWTESQDKEEDKLESKFMAEHERKMDVLNKKGLMSGLTELETERQKLNEERGSEEAKKGDGDGKGSR